jgi:hypothetical protein
VIVAVNVEHLVTLDTENTRKHTFRQPSAEHHNIILGSDLFHDEWSERVQNNNNKISKEEWKSREIERR